MGVYSLLAPCTCCTRCVNTLASVDDLVHIITHEVTQITSRDVSVNLAMLMTTRVEVGDDMSVGLHTSLCTLPG